MALETGQLIPIRFKDREFNAIVIDPDGLAPDKPTIGLGFRGMERHIGIRQQTLTDRVTEINGVRYLKLPSGSAFRVTEINGEDGNTYSVVEASDWVDLARDWAKNPGKLRAKSKNGLIDFLAWFAAEGLYASAYTFLKQTYSREDSEIIQRWLVSREAGKPFRQDWAYAIADKGGGSPYKHGKWTNYVYRGLFGMDAAQMKELWEAPVSGSRQIARNYIPESVGLEMVGYCERLVSILDLDSLERAHDEAIRLTQIKFRQQLDSDRLGG